MQNYLNQKPSNVYLKKCLDYDLEKVENYLRIGFKNLDFDFDNIKNKKILLKINLLRGKDPKYCVTTHPVIAEAVTRIFDDKKNKIFIGDSPGIGSGVDAALKSGYKYLTEKYNVKLINLDNPVPIHKLKDLTDEHVFRKLPVSKKINDFDLIINLAKFKTHGQMGLTLAVKNMFGAIVGTHKAQQHFGAGTDVEKFARMLIELYYTIKPDINIIDGIYSMEGNGPGSGDPRNTGVLLIGKDGLSLDYTSCNLVNYSPGNIPIFPTAEKMGLNPDGEIKLFGDKLENLKVKKFKPANVESLQSFVSFLPRSFNRFIKNNITVRPRVIHKKCTKCKVCVNHCQADAITLNDKIKIDHEKCIRCFCCQEFCPEGAIVARAGKLNWLINLFN